MSFSKRRNIKLKTLLGGLSIIVALTTTVMIWHPTISIAQEEDPSPPEDFELAIPPGSPDETPRDCQIVKVENQQGEQATTGGGKGSTTEAIGLDSIDWLEVTVQYGPDKAGHLIQATALDGGEIVSSPENLVVDADGVVTLQFRPGTDPGLYQVALRDGPQESGAEFWVINEETPDENPKVVPLEVPAEP